ncbi:hypothetical protein HWX16_23210 [Ochrobactrum intermedium]|uniref:hypothetical protein n=1 Tax=Brucella intermedia TaxID=94625 RepID=UPI00159C1AD1|nr:hypothetical protein [Brucella intermedia]NVM43196.1 hypothetical protein [Brucella intermedia]
MSKMDGEVKMPSIKDLLDAFAASWRVALVALLASAGILVADFYKLEYVADTSRWIINGAFIVGIVSGAILISYLVSQLARVISWPFLWYLAKTREKDKEKKLQEHAAGIHDLPEEQRYILAYFFTTKERAFAAEINHRRLVPLITRGYVKQQGGTHGALDWPHFIPEHIWNEMALNEEAYTIPKNDLHYPLKNPYFS